MKQAPLRVLIHQGGPIPGPLSTTALARVATELERAPADLVVLSELALSPYFPATSSIQPDSAVPLDGPEVGMAVEIARLNRTHLVLPLALARGRGAVWNACVLAGPDGLVVGRMVSGPTTGTPALAYAKVHLSENLSAVPGVHEKYHFVAGDGFLVWDTPLGRIAPLICYDRSFPEAWRTVTDAGAELIVLPIATARPERVRMLEAELCVGAVYNGVFVVAACKGGEETTDAGTVRYSGGSVVIGPDGAVIERAATPDGDQFLRGELDREVLERYPRTFHYARDRRPGAYARWQEPSPKDAEAADG